MTAVSPRSKNAMHPQMQSALRRLQKRREQMAHEKTEKKTELLWVTRLDYTKPGIFLQPFSSQGRLQLGWAEFPTHFPQTDNYRGLNDSITRQQSRKISFTLWSAWRPACWAVQFDKLDTAKMHGLDTFEVSSLSRSSCWACQAMLFDKLDIAKMHELDMLNVSSRVQTWRDEPSGIWAKLCTWVWIGLTRITTDRNSTTSATSCSSQNTNSHEELWIHLRNVQCVRTVASACNVTHSENQNWRRHFWPGAGRYKLIAINLELQFSILQALATLVNKIISQLLHEKLHGSVPMTTEVDTNGTTTLSRVNLSGYIGHVTIWIFTIACCLVVGLGLGLWLGLDLVSGW